MPVMQKLRKAMYAKEGSLTGCLPGMTLESKPVCLKAAPTFSAALFKEHSKLIALQARQCHANAMTQALIPCRGATTGAAVY